MEDEITCESQKSLNIFEGVSVVCPTQGWILSHSWIEHCLGESTSGSQRCILRGWSSGGILAVLIAKAELLCMNRD